MPASTSARPGAKACAAAAALLAILGIASPVRAAEHVFLIGDAGDPSPGEPVLTALRSQIEEDPSRTYVVFLGDNIYPRGLPAEGTPQRPEAERRLRAQIDAVRGTGARALFIPGNHDWDRHGAGGWYAVRREADFVEETGGSFAGFEPRSGCPGPSVVDPWPTLRLVALDTQWWLHAGPRPEGAESGCAAASDEEVSAALDRVLDAPGRDVIVVAHHPLVSGGGHGGHFSWKDHIFPLRAWKGWMWLPLPVIGSAYPLGREAGAFSQDVTASRYKHMIQVLEPVLKAKRPLVYAAGHDHGLQVLTADTARYLVVSGAGIVGHTRTPARLDSTVFRSGAAGFVRLDFDEGRRLLTVVTVDKTGAATEAYHSSLE
jgi:hypothetical protein